MPDGPTPAVEVVDQLVAAVEPAMVATTGPRYFGFVIGGALDAATAADVLAVGWTSPRMSTYRRRYPRSPKRSPAPGSLTFWVCPADVSFGFVTGAQGANTVCLAAARHQVLADVGWDVERDGLAGGPAVTVVASEERHATIDRSLRLLGLGAGTLQPVPADRNGAIDVAALGKLLASKPAGPTIVCLQAGNVNTGAVMTLRLRSRRRTCTVPGPRRRRVRVVGGGQPGEAVVGRRHPDRRLLGHRRPQWLNVPYDSGYAFCAHPDAHAAAMAYTAAYLVGTAPAAVRSPGDYVLESSRRARGFATWAALRELGRSGIAELVDRCCALARRFATQLAAIDGISVVNDVVLNEVLVQFGHDDATTERVIEAVQRSGQCWMGSTTWHGQRLMRISVSSWRTTEADVDRSVRAIIAAASA